MSSIILRRTAGWGWIADSKDDGDGQQFLLQVNFRNDPAVFWQKKERPQACSDVKQVPAAVFN